MPKVTPDGRTRSRNMLVKGGGLVAIAVASSLLWWLVRGGDPTAPDQQATLAESPLTSGEFVYAVVAGPVSQPDCGANSYGRVRGWFAEHPCSRLSRSLYVTESGSARALVSVAEVTMPDGGGARQLKAVTDTEGTGNVNDLLRDGTASIPGAPNVAAGEYASTVSGPSVTIVEANFFAGHSDPALLRRISTDALRLAETLP